MTERRDADPHDLFPATIETERLRLESVDGAIDTLETYEICAGDDGIEAVTRWMPWELHDHPDETAGFLTAERAAWADGTNAGYVVRPREGEVGAGEVAGFCGLACHWELSVGSLGLWLRRRFWGRGYSGERATALVELAFDRLDLETVVTGHVAGNEKSAAAIRRYVDRLGGRRDGVERNSLAFPDGTVHDEAHYSIRQSEWRAATDGGTSVL